MQSKILHSMMHKKKNYEMTTWKRKRLLGVYSTAKHAPCLVKLPAHQP